MNGENLLNYFNYFTEIEEHFQRVRGTSLFLLSPLDWALIETWKNSGVPLEAVLRGIDAAFEKSRSKRSRAQMVNSLAYCIQAVMVENQRLADAGVQSADASKDRPEPPPFPLEDLRRFISDNAAAIRRTDTPAFIPIADSLVQILDGLDNTTLDLEAMEQRLTVLEQKLVALARGRQTDDKALRMKADLDSYLKPWRSKMTAPQLALLEAQFLERAVLDDEDLPRLSLFYLR